MSYDSGKCEELPDDIPHLKKTTIAPPAYHGTSVEVECEEGYSLSGNTTITCINEKSWKYGGDSPQCTLGGFVRGLSAGEVSSYL